MMMESGMGRRDRMEQAVRIALCVLLLVGGAQARWGASNVEKEAKNPADVVHELTEATFNSTLWAAPATWALVEFYAHWCGACKNYKPHYERVARLFNGPNAVHAGEVYLARVDCADKANQELCARFAVSYYPTLVWAAPPILAFGDRVAKGEELEEVKNAYSAEKLLEWINKRVAKTYSLSDATTEEAVAAAKSQTNQILQMAASVHDTEEATATAFKIMLDERLLNSKNRGPFIQFLQLLVAHHPSKRCRKGSADLLVNLVDIWPTGESPREALSSSHLCGESSPRNFWVSCRGDNRGYNCGLWLLFHSLSVRVSDSESSAAFWAIRTFVDHFFNCRECREHFLEMSSSANSTNTRRDLVMWLWRAHNEVNKRLAKEEADTGKGDSKPRRTVWPTKQQCSDCIKGSQDKTAKGGDEPDWDNDAVFKFLTDWYGPSLQPLFKGNSKEPGLELGKGKEGDGNSRSRSSVVKGAAIGVLITSCGFALVACWWRKQQKKRKHMRRRL